MSRIYLLFWLLPVAILGQNCDPKFLIDKLNLEPLPKEGGFFRQTFKSSRMHKSNKTYSTAIYYLETAESFSSFHRLRSDEVYHFYLGDPVELVLITSDGVLTRVRLGNNLTAGEVPQAIVPKNVWQASRPINDGTCSLLGTTVAPGFEFEDFESKKRSDLLKLFPQHREVILRFTRD